MRAPRRATHSKSAWIVRSKTLIERVATELANEGRLCLPSGLNWTLRPNSAAPGVRVFQFDLPAKILVHGRWIPATIRHHRPDTPSASGKTGLQVEKGYGGYASDAQLIWSSALERASNPLTRNPPRIPLSEDSPQRAIALNEPLATPGLTRATPSQFRSPLDLNLSPPRDDGDTHGEQGSSLTRRQIDAGVLDSREEHPHQMGRRGPRPC